VRAGPLNLPWRHKILQRSPAPKLRRPLRRCLAADQPVPPRLPACRPSWTPCGWPASGCSSSWRRRTGRWRAPPAGPSRRRTTRRGGGWRRCACPTCRRRWRGRGGLARRGAGGGGRGGRVVELGGTGARKGRRGLPTGCLVARGSLLTAATAGAAPELG
jgi:hypothetical protein